MTKAELEQRVAELEKQLAELNTVARKAEILAMDACDTSADQVCQALFDLGYTCESTIEYGVVVLQWIDPQGYECNVQDAHQDPETFHSNVLYEVQEDLRE